MSNSGSIQTSETVSDFSTSDEHNKDGAFSVGAASNIALVDSRPSEVISQDKEIKENSKSRMNSSKGVKQGKATPTYDPRQFIRRIVYKECNEKNILGSVLYYDARKEMFYVEYEDGEEKYVEKNELFNKLATEKDVLDARPILPSRNSSKKIVVEKKKRSTSGEESAPTKKKGNTSGRK